MKILAIETATENCSAALLINEDCQQRQEIAPRNHTRLILPMIDSLLNEAGLTIGELDAIAFGQGPGAFTGIRVAIGVVQGLAFAHDIPVIPISSLAALAQQFAEEHDAIAVAIDARMGEVYWGLYERNTSHLMSERQAEIVCKPEDIHSPTDNIWFTAGTGWETYSQELANAFKATIIGSDTQAFPSAKSVATLAADDFKKGKTISVTQAKPSYIRNKVVNN